MKDIDDIQKLLETLKAMSFKSIETYAQMVNAEEMDPATGMLHSKARASLKPDTLTNYSSSIRLAEFLSDEDFIDKDNRPAEILSIDPTLSKSLQDLQLLKDLKNAISEPIDTALSKNILKVLKLYMPLKSYAADDSVKSLSKYLELTIKNMSTALKDEIAANAENPKHKKYENLHIQCALEEFDVDEAFSHPTLIASKAAKENETEGPKHQATWYAKFIRDKSKAIYEVIAQELFRLIIPYQPKTRIAKSEDSKLYILSKEIVNATSLEAHYFENFSALNSKINSCEYKGLGRVMMMCLLLHETDARLANLLVDDQNRVIKIDGDWCFSGEVDPLAHDSSYKIKARDIAILPFVETFKPGGWLDIFGAGKFNSLAYANRPERALINYQLSEHPEFRREINETLLKLLILPSSVLKDFINGYTDNKDIARHIQKILTRHLGEIREQAVLDKSFQKYLVSDEANQYFKKSFTELLDFKTMRDSHIVTQEMYTAIHGKFSRIQKTARINIQENEQKSRTTTPNISPKNILLTLPKDTANDVKGHKPEDARMKLPPITSKYKKEDKKTTFFHNDKLDAKEEKTQTEKTSESILFKRIK